MKAAVTPSQGTYLADVTIGPVTLTSGGYRPVGVRRVKLGQARHDRFGILRETVLVPVSVLYNKRAIAIYRHAMAAAHQVAADLAWARVWADDDLASVFLGDVEAAQALYRRLERIRDGRI